MDVQKHMITLGHCMMNPDFMEDFKHLYDFSKENQIIYDKYIKNGNFTEEDLKNFARVEICDGNESVEDEEEW